MLSRHLEQFPDFIPMPEPILNGSAVIDAIKQSGIQIVLALPDITTSGGIMAPLSQDPHFRLIRVCKEDEAIGIASGLTYSRERALVFIQHTGLLDSINAIRAVPVEYDLPVCMLVGLLNNEPGGDPYKSKTYGVRIVPPILDVMGVRHVLVDTDADAAKIPPVIDRAYAESKPVVIMIGRRPEPALPDD